jgi:hypothetical protein
MSDRRWIIDSLGAPAFERLASELPGSELQSVLLEVLRRRAKARAPAEVLAQYRRDSFCKPAVFDQRMQTVTRHIRTMLGALDSLEQHGYAFGARSVDVLATPERETLADRNAEALGGRATRKLLDHPYYSGGLRYMLWVTAPDGARIPLVDGGAFDWLAKLASNRRAVYIATGTGAQLIALRFRVQDQSLIEASP